MTDEPQWTHGVDAAFQEVFARVQCYLEDGEAAAVIGVQARPAGEALRRHWLDTPPGEADERGVAVSYLIAWWHFCRYLELPPEHEGSELEVALSLFGYFHGRDPRSVPFELRRLWAEPGATLIDPNEQTRRGADALTTFLANHHLPELDTATGHFTAALAQVSQEHPRRALFLSNLAMACYARYQHTGDEADRQTFLRHQRSCVAATSVLNRNVVARLRMLFVVLTQRHVHTPDLAGLDEAIGYARLWAAIGGPHGEAPDAPMVIAGLLHDRCQTAYHAGSADEAIELLRRVTTADAADDPGEAHHLLGAMLQLRFDHAGAPADLDDAVRHGELAAAAPADAQPRATRLTNLANVLRLRHELHGDLADVERATGLMRQAVALGTGDPGQDAVLHANLGNVLHTRYRATGSLVDLNDAVVACRTATRLAPAPHHRPHLLATLGMVLRERFDAASHREDIEEAVRSAREAVATAGPGDTRRVIYLSDLGLILFLRHRTTGDPADLDAAIDAQMRAIETGTPDDPFLPNRLDHLALCFLARYQLGHRAAHDPAADLDLAIDTARRAAQAFPLSNVNAVIALTHLAEALLLRHGDRLADADLDEAVRMAALAHQHCPPGFVSRAAVAILYADTLLFRGDGPDRRTALTVLREAAGLADAAPHQRLDAAVRHATVLAVDGDWPDAAESFALAVRLMPLAVWRGQHRTGQEQRLARVAGVVGAAAAVALRLTDPVRAVEHLEFGRAVLWGQTLELRADATAVSAARPDLARRLDEIRRLLDGAATMDGPAAAPAP